MYVEDWVLLSTLYIYKLIQRKTKLQKGKQLLINIAYKLHVRTTTIHTD